MSEASLSGAPFALLENTRDPDAPARRYTRPAGAVMAQRPEEVMPALAALEAARSKGLHACGYISYEAGYALQGLPLPSFPDVGPPQPLLHFLLFEGCELISPAESTAWLQSRAGEEQACAIHAAELAEDEANYSRKIAQIRGLIRDGETYQVNYTLPCRFRHAGSAIALYLALRQTQRVAYSAFLNFPEARILSLSPELFIERRGQTLTTRPMKGTAARGASATEDREIAEHLRHDPKSRAENVMIVDLLRNDLGRVAQTGSVKVPALFEVETYETLQQMTSTITATLNEGTTLPDIMAALFPCGSITGAPKRRTMQLIAELEQEPRGIYTGAIGYIDPNGDFCFSVPIRTVVSHGDGKALMGVGSGIVYDSDAHAEYAEVQLKTRFLHEVNRELGLIESMHLSPDGSIRHRDLHLTRLREAAQTFGFYVPERAIREKLDAYIKHHPQSEARRLRLQLNSDGTFSLADFAIPPVPAQPVIVVSTQRINSASIFRRHKTTQRQLYEAEYARAVEQGAYEVLFLNEHGRVAEAARHNVFIRKNGKLLTPPISEGALPGILRHSLQDQLGEQPLTLDDLKSADAIYIGNAVRGLTEVKVASMITIIRANLINTDHAAALIRLMDEYASGPTGGGQPLNAYARAHLVASLRTRPGAHTLLALKRDEFGEESYVGLLNAFEGFSTFACKPLLNIHDVVVTESQRGQGIGRRLMEAAEELARELGCCKLTLEVLEGNSKAQAAYKSLGYAGYELTPEMGKALFWQKKL